VGGFLIFLSYGKDVTGKENSKRKLADVRIRNLTGRGTAEFLRACGWLAAILFLGSTACSSATPPQLEMTPSSPVSTQASQEKTWLDDFHYTGKYCERCHERIPEKGADPLLKFGGSFKSLCDCHLTSPYVHPVDMALNRRLQGRIPPELPLQAGKVTCLTCHNLHLQCAKRLVNRTSLRGAPYSNRTDFCFRCHDKERYARLDPHKQFSPSGNLIVEKCLYCHSSKPDETRDIYKDVGFIGELEVLCQRCHMIRGNHAGNFDHMVEPSAKMLAVMNRMEKTFNIILPLDAKGKMTCVTCHNPHDRGLMPPEKPSAGWAGSKYRHRLPGRLCMECHQL
jgi:hypothetical protein